MDVSSFPVIHSLKISRVVFELRARNRAELPSFLGSTLRGAFGHALKATACLEETRAECAQTCRQPAHCPYTYVFETQLSPHFAATKRHEDLPHPYLIVPPELNAPAPSRRYAVGDTFSFQLVLVGAATDHLPAAVLAIHEMARSGLGYQRIPFDVVSFHAPGASESDLNTLRGATTTLGDLIAPKLESLRDATSVSLRFVTPVRIRLGGDLQSKLTFSLLVKNLGRRIESLARTHGTEPVDLNAATLTEWAADIQPIADHLTWNDLSRYSNRQRTTLKLGGLVGEISFAGPRLAEFVPFLAAGEVLHLGTATSFGLGRYELRPAAE